MARTRERQRERAFKCRKRFGRYGCVARKRLFGLNRPYSDEPPQMPPDLGEVMSYTRDIGEVSARYRPSGQVEHSTLRAGTVARYVATGEVTNGQFGLFEWEMPPSVVGGSPHFHKT